MDVDGSAVNRMRSELSRDLTTITEQFSTDKKDSAINRLIEMLDQTKRRVEESLTLDQEHSPLARLSRELKQQISSLTLESQKFQAEVRQTLEVEKARQAEAARGTQHGLEFEELVGQVLMGETAGSDDTCEAVGTTAGSIPRCKTGDYVIEMGPESAAPGARVVIECKQKANCSDKQALAELDEARRNRGGQVGVFVLSRSCAPETTPLLRRIGSDIICIWDKDDPTTNIILKSAISIARALCVRQRVSEATAADLAEMEIALGKVEKTIKKLEDVTTWTTTIQSNSQKILDAIGSVKDVLESQLDLLRQSVSDLKQAPQSTA
jgi:hypothetical protein